MSIKEKVKHELEYLNEEELQLVNEYIRNLRKPKNKKRGIKTHHFKGMFDHVNIRKQAYE
ncbi:MAG: hypothetical protein K9I94_10425 [Bacteroidales bacterium]|nr:hypothetical protein [Bacteroidales bacterium]